MSQSDEPGAPGPRNDNAGVRPDIPTARPAEGGASTPGAGTGARPIFELADDRCPRCGEPLPTEAVVCVKCGYDQRANTVREVETGVVEVAEPATAPKAAKPDFVTPGKLSPKALGIAGAVLTVAAMVAAGVYAPVRSFGVIAALVLLTIYTIAINSATGVAAVAVAARLNSQPFGRLDVALARMFAAFALFAAVIRTRPLLLGSPLLSMGVSFVVGALLYFGAIMLLFKKDRKTTSVIALAHFILWILLELGPVLGTWASSAVAGTPAR